MFLGVASLLSLSCLSLASAALPDGRRNANIMRPPTIPIISVIDTPPVVSRNGTELPPYNFTYYFDQLIDHNDPSKGTFKQRFWHTYEFYESGGPIILMTPGEANAQPYSGYLTNRTITGATAQQNNGSVIILEHRFYGLSNPAPDLSGKSLALHTLQQAIDDLEYFAFNVKLPQPDGDNVTPDKAPWILAGGSYSGALTSWTMVNKPDLFAAGYASSAVVEAILDYWGYFEPIRQFMPKNCSADVEAVIAHIDTVFTGKDTEAIDHIKNLFGLGDMTHLDDVAGALRNNLWDWQSLQPTSGASAQFFEFCDALEVKNGVSASAEGWGLDHALTAWGNYWTNFYLGNLCGDETAEDCLGTYNATQEFYTDTSVDNAGRSWNWIVCNEVGYLQDGPPENVPAVVSRLTKPASDIRQCELMFSDVFSASNPPKMAQGVARTNEVYKGWNVSIERLFFANGQRDPWREATVSADGVNVPSTVAQPIAIGDGFHCSDLSIASGAVDSTVKSVQDKWFATIPGWLAVWIPGKVSAPQSYKRSEPIAKRAVSFKKAANPFFRAPVEIL